MSIIIFIKNLSPHSFIICNDMLNFFYHKMVNNIIGLGRSVLLIWYKCLSIIRSSILPSERCKVGEAFT